AMIGVDRGPIRRRHVDGVEDVFDADRQTMQGPDERASIQHACVLANAIRIDMRPSPHIRFPLRDTLQAIVEQRLGGDLARGKLACGFCRAQTIQCAHSTILRAPRSGANSRLGRPCALMSAPWAISESMFCHGGYCGLRLA